MRCCLQTHMVQLRGVVLRILLVKIGYQVPDLGEEHRGELDHASLSFAVDTKIKSTCAQVSVSA